MKDYLNFNEAREILGLDGDVNIESVKNAYRKNAVRTHPDKGGDVNLFKRIKRAYDFFVNNLNPVESKQTRSKSNFHEMNFYNDGGEHSNPIDQMIFNMSNSDKRRRFDANIIDWKDSVKNYYVLVKGKYYGNNDWGYALVTYPQILNHYRWRVGDAKEYIEKAGIDKNGLEFLGGGKLSMEWSPKEWHVRDYSLVIRADTIGEDFGPVKSKLAVKTCLDNFVRDHIPDLRRDVGVFIH